MIRGKATRFRPRWRRALLATLLPTAALLHAAPTLSAANEVVTRAEVAGWADETFNAALAAHRISGAVVSVVRDGEILLARGYGVADVVTQSPADAATMRVRIGSTTKTFTATLIAQLLQQGRIASIDDPANDYLARFRLPDNDGVAVTLRHLLTHTAGFEDRFFFIGATEPVKLPASAEVIESLRPAYARSAGQRVVYSNFGVAVLGWLIEDLTGSTIEQNMRTRLFEPLGMDATELAVTIDEPDGLARPGLLDADGVVGPVPFTAINPALAQTGSIVSTARDMARYMNAQLGLAQNPGAALDDAVIARLQTPLAGNAPGLTALGMTWFLDEWAGLRTVSHGGNWAGFHTWLLLLPEQRTGIFVSLLSEAPPAGLLARFVSAAWPGRAAPPSPATLSALPLVESFLARFYGPKRPLPEQPVGWPAAAPSMAGLYRADRRPFESVEALSSLVYFGADAVRVSVRHDGLYFGTAGPWLAEGESRFILDAPSRPRLAFTAVAGDEATAGRTVLVPDIGIYTFSRIGALADPKAHAIALHLLLPLTLLGLLVLPGLRRNKYLLAPAAVGAAGAAMVGCVTLGLSPGDTLLSSYFTGHPERLLAFVAAANVQALGSVVTLTAGAYSRGRARAASLALAAIGLAVALILAQYNGIGLPRI